MLPARRSQHATGCAAGALALLIVSACANDLIPTNLGVQPCFPLVAPGGPAAKGAVYLHSRASDQVVGALATTLPATEGHHVAGAHQRWFMAPTPAGGSIWFRGSSGACLARVGSGANAGATMAACGQPGTDWELVPDRPSAYHLKAPGAPQFLAVVDGRAAQGRPLVLAGAPELRTSFLLIDASFRAPGVSACVDPPLDQMTFLATHNAFHTSGEGDKILPNQSRSIAQQLDDGVRGLLLDVYDWEGTVWTCHGACAIPGLRGRPLAEHLTTIAAFLAKDPQAIVTLFLEDMVGQADDLCRVVAETPAVAALIFDPAQHGVLERGWPRRSVLVAANQRLLIFSQREGREACGIQHNRRYTSENFWSLGPPGMGYPDLSCVSRWVGTSLASCTGEAFRPLFLMNHYRDTLLAASCAGDNTTLLRRRALEICAQAAAAKPNFIAVDCYETGDAAALVAELNRCDPQGCRCPP